jgi:tyrosine-protein phosphatase YwqE
MALPRGCHIIPRIDVSPAERERILLDLLRRATDEGCRKDIVAVLVAGSVKKKPCRSRAR